MSFPPFDQNVPPGGYAWWYVDALSHDGHHALTVIAFVGSVFSPYYYHARSKGRADPEDHCAINVALYGRGGRWAMTERDRGALARSADRLAIGPSALHWDGGALTIDFAEIGVPLPRRVAGRVRVEPAALAGEQRELDPGGRHRWSPVAPLAEVSVSCSHPALSWEGTGYLDFNTGDEPLEDGFTHWHWSRAALEGHGEAAILYEAHFRGGGSHAFALGFGADGSRREHEVPGGVALPATGWRVARHTRADAGAARVLRTLEDTPFYARSLLETRLHGKRGVAMHESLSLDRFRAPWVRLLLPFRMPRRG